MKNILLFILSLLIPFTASAQVDGLYTVELNLDGMVIDDKSYQNVDADVKSILVDIDNKSRSFLLSKDAFFDAHEFIVAEQLSSLSDTDVVYTWDFDDGSEVLSGRQVVHRFEEEGSYRVKLVAKVGDVELVEYIIVSVYSNQVMLVANDMPALYERDLLTGFSLDRTNVFHVAGHDAIGSRALQTRYMVDRFMASYLSPFEEIEYLFVYGKTSLAALAFVAEEEGLSFVNKKLVILDDGSAFMKDEYVAKMLGVIQPAMAIYSDENFDLSRFLKSDFSSVEVLEVPVVEKTYSFVHLYFLSLLLLLSFAYFAKRVLQWPIRSLMQLVFLTLVWMYFGLKLGLSMYISMGVLGYGSLLLLRTKSFWFLPGELIRFIVYVALFGISYLFYEEGHKVVDLHTFVLASGLMILIIENLSRKFEYNGLKKLVSYFAYELLFLLLAFTVLNSSLYLTWAIVSPEQLVLVIVVLAVLAFYVRASKIFLSKK